ncbi:hypothetical protein M3Y96_00857000 [Aphelenchoides besseyi]|nr:hypothetical protein M3Y96_00857000 [Aphelenchoides besseyi]
MDLNVKQELIDGIDQIEIKNEENLSSYTTMTEILGFEYKSSTRVFAREFIVTVDGSQVAIADGDRTYFYTCNPMEFTFENIRGQKNKVVLKTVTWRGVNNTNEQMEPITEVGILTITFGSFRQAADFRQQLLNHRFTDLSE